MQNAMLLRIMTSARQDVCASACQEEGRSRASGLYALSAVPSAPSEAAEYAELVACPPNSGHCVIARPAGAEKDASEPIGLRNPTSDSSRRSS